MHPATAGGAKVAVVSYGNGVVTSLQARKVLEEEGAAAVDIVDCPYISGIAAELPSTLAQYDAVLFADMCKEGQAPLAQIAVQLQSRGELPAQWRVVSAPRTYNPLGCMVTFLNVEDVVEGCRALL